MYQPNLRIRLVPFLFLSVIILLNVLHLFVVVFFGFLYEHFHEIWNSHGIGSSHHLVHLCGHLLRLAIEWENDLPSSEFFPIAWVVPLVNRCCLRLLFLGFLAFRL